MAGSSSPDCGHPGRFMQQWYGGTMTQAGSRSVLIGSGLVSVAPVTLKRPALQASRLALPASAADPAMSLLARVRAAALAGEPTPSAGGQRASLNSAQSGRISGRVTDQH